MKTRPLITLALAVACAAPAFAGPLSSSSIGRHRLADCMSRQMAASRTLSYYGAESLCKQQLRAQEHVKAQNDKVTANSPVTTLPSR
jgi:hypothetical protein